MPEVGDMEKPKLVFFFDEAHLLFDDMSPEFGKKIEQVVRLIRSKGDGICFISQSPADIPDDILAQLGNRIQHALRAYTPKDQKAVKVAAETFRANPDFDTAEVISNLGTGQALVSVLDENGAPTVVEQVDIVPPQSHIGAIEDDLRKQLMDIQEDESVKEEAQELRKLSEEEHEKVITLSEQAQAAHEEMLTYFRKTDDIRTAADDAHKKFIEARNNASAKHEEFKAVLSDIHVINKKLGSGKPRKRRSDKKPSFISFLSSNPTCKKKKTIKTSLTHHSNDLVKLILPSPTNNGISQK